MTQYILWFNEVGMNDVGNVGGKNASLGEMITELTHQGVKVPMGFATTAKAYTEFLDQSGLKQKITDYLAKLNIEDVVALATAGKTIREWVMQTPLQPAFIDAITQAYQKLTSQYSSEVTFAVRSSATAEDLPNASFAGQQETFLNVRGLEAILESIKLVFASLYNDRAISYRVHQGFAHELVAISAGIQQMVRSDIGVSGVMFSIDPESGFSDAILINASYGLGEMVVQGAVNPDEFYVYKPALKEKRIAILRKNRGSKLLKMIYAEKNSLEKVCKVDVPEEEQQRFCLSDEEITQLAEYALIIEKHYGRPMDIEWAKDGLTGELLILQSRPETVQSQNHSSVTERYVLNGSSELLVTGRSVGQKIGQGKAKVLKQLSEMSRVQPGDVLVTDMTDPDWEPVMKRASAIVTNRGGRTCHAAIIARELGIPAVVGCGDATHIIQEDQEITVSCAEGDTGNVYQGLIPFEIHTTNLASMPEIPVKLMLNVANPDRAFELRQLPNHGVGLARLEFIISQMIGIHPRALLEFAKIPADVQEKIRVKIAAYASPKDYYVQRLAEGIATIAASFAPNKVIVRLSDFKSNEYRHLLGGELYEPIEENPMLGFRGAGRYADPQFKDCFALECEAVKLVREKMGLTNVAIMIPFVRTLTEAAGVIDVLNENGLRRGEKDLEIIMMCEIPSNALLAEEFLEYFDGFSIGSNDLTQLTLGIDRDSGIVAASFDERNLAVKKLLSLAIQACKKHGKYIGICGQGPSDHSDFAEWLVEQGIATISLNPDTVVDTWLRLGK